MARKWFKPKRYGYGATPVTWQGWALVIGFMAATFGLVGWLVEFDLDTEPEPQRVAIFFICVALLVVALWIISKRTTDGEWRWRWGGRE